MKDLATAQLRACLLLFIALAVQSGNLWVVLVQLLMGLSWDLDWGADSLNKINSIAVEYLTSREDSLQNSPRKEEWKELVKQRDLGDVRAGFFFCNSAIKNSYLRIA